MNAQTKARRKPLTREQRLALPRNAYDDNLVKRGVYFKQDSGFWTWQSNSGKVGLAHTQKQAIAQCIKHDGATQ